MNLLDLMNNVLVRLREEKVTTSTYDSTPFYRMIAACVNDAKDLVENAWDWTVLRDVDFYTVVQGQSFVNLAGNNDQHYLVKNIAISDTGQLVPEVPYMKMFNNYSPYLQGGAPQGEVSEWSYSQNIPSVVRQIMLWPPSNRSIVLWVLRSKHQAPLVTWDTQLMVPSLPVYTLATALASRERGEVGGAPTNELFALADKTLSDAIALDVAYVDYEINWTVV